MMTGTQFLTPHQRATIAEMVGSFLVGFLGSGLFLLALWLSVVYTPLGDVLTWVLPSGEKAAWYLIRATGIVAYLLLSGATAWGLVLSTKIVKTTVPAPLALALHNSLSWLALALAAGHAFLLLFDHYYLYRPIELLIPFLGPYRPAWVGLGTISLYGSLLVAASFSVRKRIGHRAWRLLHYLSFPLYLLATLHGFMAGSDSGGPTGRAMYLGSALLVLFLTNYRLLATR